MIIFSPAESQQLLQTETPPTAVRKDEVSNTVPSPFPIPKPSAHPLIAASPRPFYSSLEHQLARSITARSSLNTTPPIDFDADAFSPSCPDRAMFCRGLMLTHLLMTKGIANGDVIVQSDEGKEEKQPLRMIYPSCPSTQALQPVPTNGRHRDTSRESW